jgi:hypothetical protein
MITPIKKIFSCLDTTFQKWGISIMIGDGDDDLALTGKRHVNPLDS